MFLDIDLRGFGACFFVRMLRKELKVKVIILISRCQTVRLLLCPVQVDLKVGLLRAAIKKAGLTVEDFQRLIK